MTFVVAFGLSDVGESLREAFFMFWETLWALVLGFTLSGAVQAFVSRADMQRKLGDDAGSPKLILTEPGIGYRWIGSPD